MSGSLQHPIDRAPTVARERDALALARTTCRLPNIVDAIDAHRSTRLLLSTGHEIEVEGSLQDVEKLLQNAARSSPGTLAWLKDADSGESVGVNPARVVSLSPAAQSAGS